MQDEHSLSLEALRAARLSYFAPTTVQSAPPLVPTDSVSTLFPTELSPQDLSPQYLAPAPYVLVLASDSDPDSAPASTLENRSAAAPYGSDLASDSDSDSAPASALATWSAAAPCVTAVASCTTEPLPFSTQQFKKNEYKKYRDAVCDLLQLSFICIGGNGNCFFESVSTLLKHERDLILDSDSIRQQVVTFLRECLNNQHSILGERCVMDMEGELGLPITGASRKNSGLTPETVEEYLNVSAIDGVWIQGYHWLRAVAAIFDCCVVTIIHGHQHLYLFGDPTLERIHLYKRDVETHFDALPSSKALHPPITDDDTALLALAMAASSSSSSEDKSNQRQPVRKSARLCHQIATVVQSRSDSDNSESDSRNVKCPSYKKHKSAPVVQPRLPVLAAKTNPIPEPAPVVQPHLAVSASKRHLMSQPAKVVGTKVVQLDDTLLVIPPNFAACW